MVIESMDLKGSLKFYLSPSGLVEGLHRSRVLSWALSMEMNDTPFLSSRGL